MSDLSQDLYQSLILDHSRSPHHAVKIDKATHQKRGYNASCGDKLDLYARIQEKILQDVGFVSQGCAIFRASCSLLSDLVVGKSLDDVQEILQLYEKMILEKEGLTDPTHKAKLGKLSLFENVKRYPGRVKCALLGARTLEALLLEDPT